MWKERRDEECIEAIDRDRGLCVGDRLTGHLGGGPGPGTLGCRSRRDSIPVVTETTVITGDREITTRVYADGSPIVSSIETPRAGVDDRAGRTVSGCREASGAGNLPFYDCRVQTNTALYTITFLSDGRRSSIGQAQVSNYRQIGYWTGAATVNSTGFNLVRRDQSGSSPAHVQGTLYVTFLLGSGSGVYNLSFYVRDMSRWDSTP